MTGLPSGITVGIEFVPGSGTFTDVTADVDAQTGISLKFGRTSEFSAPSVATCNLTLDDTAGKYTALNATSPYYPNIRPRRRIKVSNTYGPRFVGYIKGFPPGFDGTRRIVAITATDRTDLLAHYTLPGVVQSVIAASNPTWYFPMSDAGSNSTVPPLTLSEFNTRVPPLPLVYSLWAAGGTAPTVASIPSPAGAWDTPWVQFTQMTAPGNAGYIAPLSSANGVRLTGATWSMTLAYRQSSLTNLTDLWYQECAGQPYAAGVGFNAGSLTIQYPTVAGVSSWFIAMPNDMNPHVVHVVASGAGGVLCYLDGVVVQTDANVAALTSPGQASVGGVPGSYYSGALAHFALWQGTALTAAQVTAQVTGILASTGQTTDAVINRLLGFGGLSAPDMNLGTGSEIVGAYPQVGKTIAAAVQDMAVTEGGGAVVFVDVDGRVRFNPRTYRNATTPAMTIDAVLDLDGTNFVPSYDDLTLINSSQVTCNDTGKASTYTDAVSAAEFQVTNETVTTYASTDQAALNLAQDRVSRQSEPALRVSQLTIDFLTATGTATYSTLAGVTIGSRVRVANIPTTITGPSGAVVYFPFAQLDSYVEGWTETIAIDAYTVVFDTSPADNPPRFIWDDAVYGRWQADPGSMTLSATITASATSLVLLTAATHPALTNAGGDLPLLMVIDQEVVNVTAVSGPTSPQTLTITRAQNGTLATAHTAGAVMNVYPTADWTL